MLIERATETEETPAPQEYYLPCVVDSCTLLLVPFAFGAFPRVVELVPAFRALARVVDLSGRPVLSEPFPVYVAIF